ncbi:MULTISPECIES: hypothetical protein [unclassified Mesorhizobium]|uniref:hypothetical protein n=1 Tax=unclassified Mesorhizobium TaxID=325217 RepID=UPI001125DEDB|nr:MULTISPECIES: hypothetical protein [unclassified Mesorhizobium]TPJ29165.1 hypothetical protein FJ425_08425 [Mesorhizobium sp. B2-7-2]TPN92476.1 hypothetical protein FJ980_27630 [Mesorhizobium sp. B1-1-5]
MAAFPPGKTASDKTASENKKPDCSFVQSGKVARSGEEKASHVPARVPTVEPAEKFHGKSIVAGKIVAAWQPCKCCTAQF